MTSSEKRKIEEVLTGQAASDGAGVKLKRVFGGGDLSRFDPFLMLDEFGSKDASDYIAGFPSHPHRGFETVTYMLEGHMEHRDHMGNVGQLQPGDVQWMKAGSGVIHSEMPKQEEGRMRGFQLWVNLPAAEKMTPAEYSELAAADIPRYRVDGAEVKAIAGRLAVNGEAVAGVLEEGKAECIDRGRSTEPGYIDVSTPAAQTLNIEIPDGHTALVYVYEGEVQIAEQRFALKPGQLARLSRFGELELVTAAGSRLLVITGKPIGEPIVQRGPFVMNTTAEIQQAIRDFSEGRLVPTAEVA